MSFKKLLTRQSTHTYILEFSSKGFSKGRRPGLGCLGFIDDIHNMLFQILAVEFWLYCTRIYRGPSPLHVSF